MEGTIVATQSWSVHRDPTVFHEPDTFKPERWITETNEMRVCNFNPSNDLYCPILRGSCLILRGVSSLLVLPVALDSFRSRLSLLRWDEPREHHLTCRLGCGRPQLRHSHPKGDNSGAHDTCFLLREYSCSGVWVILVHRPLRYYPSACSQVVTPVGRRVPLLFKPRGARS